MGWFWNVVHAGLALDQLSPPSNYTFAQEPTVAVRGFSFRGQVQPGGRLVVRQQVAGCRSCKRERHYFVCGSSLRGEWEFAVTFCNLQPWSVRHRLVTEEIGCVVHLAVAVEQADTLPAAMGLAE